MRGKDICRDSALNFVMEQISDFKLSTKLSAIYFDQRDIIEQATIKCLLKILI